MHGTPPGGRPGAGGSRGRYIARATLGYAVLASLWIFLSDPLLSAFSDLSRIAWLSTAKGIAFVTVTAPLLYLALEGVPGRAGDGHPASQSGSHPIRGWPAWLSYVFAIGATLCMLALHTQVALPQGDSFMPVLLMLPIALSALMGGLGPGLTATLVATLSLDYVNIAPRGTLDVRAPEDLLQLGLLAGNGLLVSVMSEWLHRSRRYAQASGEALAAQLGTLRLQAAIADAAAEAIFAKDCAGRYILVNRETARLLGRTVEEVLGRDDRTLLVSRRRPALRARGPLRNRARRGRELPGRPRHGRRSGQLPRYQGPAPRRRRPSHRDVRHCPGYLRD